MDLIKIVIFIAIMTFKLSALVHLYFCFYTLLCARLLKVLGGPKRRICQ